MNVGNKMGGEKVEKLENLIVIPKEGILLVNGKKKERISKLYRIHKE